MGFRTALAYEFRCYRHFYSRKNKKWLNIQFGLNSYHKIIHNNSNCICLSLAPKSSIPHKTIKSVIIVVYFDANQKKSKKSCVASFTSWQIERTVFGSNFLGSQLGCNGLSWVFGLFLAPLALKCLLYPLKLWEFNQSKGVPGFN